MPLPNRQALEAMKRADLQKLCKDYGVKANLKTDALIDLLLDAKSLLPFNHSHSPFLPLFSSTPIPRTVQPQRSRSVSTRHSSRTTRVSSMVIHHTDDEQESEHELSHNEEHENRPTLEHPPPRTRKAKETQKRLGVGKPVAAGGSGPRAITKSLSVSKNKRAKGRSVKPVEDTIPEEDSEMAPASEHAEETQTDKSGRAESTRTSPIPPPSTSTSIPSTLLSAMEVDKRIAEAVQPLQDQLQSFRAELGKMQALQAELTELKTQVADVPRLRDTVATLRAEVEDLRAKTASAIERDEELKKLQDTFTTMSQRTETSVVTKPPLPPQSSGPPHAPISSEASTKESPISSEPAVLKHPGLAPSLLGKRHRDSTTSTMSGVIEEGQQEDFDENDLVKQVMRHNKKRARMLEEEETDVMNTDDPVDDAPRTPPRAAGFNIFTGPDPYDDDPPPPRTPLPHFYGTSAGPSRRATSTQNAAENQAPFFNLPPVPDTPGPFSSLPSFPYPEPPQSPTPAGPSYGVSFLGTRGRSDIFQPFGPPASSRPRSHLLAAAPVTASHGSGFVDPAALTRSPEETALGDAAFPAGSDVGPQGAQPSGNGTTKRTMYGTEMDGDSRFGDFGVEGAAGFWPPGIGGARF